MPIFMIRYKGKEIDDKEYIDAYNQNDANEYARKEARRWKKSILFVCALRIKKIS